MWYGVGMNSDTSKYPLVIAHRGVSAEYPENTLAAYRAAIDMGCHAFELDVHLTRDNIPVVVHDPQFDEADTQYRIVDLTLKQLRELRPDIPTLEEVFTLDRGDVKIMVELKDQGSDPERLVEESVKLARRMNQTGLIFGSLSPRLVRIMMQRIPDFALIAEASEDAHIDEYIEMDARHLAIKHTVATPERIQQLVNAGRRVWIFTVDDPEQAREFSGIGAEGIITNDPVRIRDV